MALTSSSTLSNAIDQYLDNLSWDGSLSKARAALEAIRYIQLKRGLRNTSGEGRSIDYESLNEQRRQIEEFLDLYDTTNRPRVSFVQGRAKE